MERFQEYYTRSGGQIGVGLCSLFAFTSFVMLVVSLAIGNPPLSLGLLTAFVALTATAIGLYLASWVELVVDGRDRALKIRRNEKLIHTLAFPLQYEFGWHWVPSYRSGAGSNRAPRLLVRFFSGTTTILLIETRGAIYDPPADWPEIRLATTGLEHAYGGGNLQKLVALDEIRAKG